MAVSQERPARTTSAPPSRAVMKGASPIWPTTRTLSSTISSVSSGSFPRVRVLFSRTACLMNSLSISERITASLKRCPSRFASSRIVSSTLSTWGFPPAVPAEPMM